MKKKIAQAKVFITFCALSEAKGMDITMKTITKIIHINDGNDVTAHNGDRLFVETSPRAETIISAFLTDGWTLHSRVFRVTPSTSPDNITFYLSGWDFLFTKEIPDDAIDESDTLLNDAISVALSIGNENSFEEDMDSDMLDDDLDLEYIEEG